MTRRASLSALAALAVLAALPAVSSRLGDAPGSRCATDGVAPGALLRVRAETPSGPRTFCSVRCAEAWDRRFAGDLTRIFVAAEDTGAEEPAESAWFARSRVETLRASGERIHAFSSAAAAAAHVAAHGGRVLDGAERPFVSRGRP